MSSSLSTWGQAMKSRSIPVLVDFFDNLQEGSDPHFDSYVVSYTQCLCTNIERSIKAQTTKQDLGEELVRLSHAQLQDHVELALRKLFDDLQEDSHYIPIDEDILASAKPLDSLYKELPKLYDSVDLDQGLEYEEEEDEDEEDEDEGEEEEDGGEMEHIAHHEFELYEEDDWYSHEYELMTDLQDVLGGSDHAELDDVSDPAPTNQHSGCGLCGDASLEMRKVRACGHDFCADCLSSQLQTEHECRYRCCLCRAEFFPRTDV
jgi:hypothetical protein